LHTGAPERAYEPVASTSICVDNPAAMPELPDVTVYVEAIERRVLGQPLERVRVWNPFLVRTARPPLDAAFGRKVLGISRTGKRIVFALEDDLYLALHLMIAGRLHWKAKDWKESGRAVLALFDFPSGKLVLTEQGSKRRAALHVLQGEAALRELDRGGIEPLAATVEQFGEALRRESHTLKRTLTDPTLFSGIGNAYSDEILHAARLSPLKLTRSLSEEEVGRLRVAVQKVLLLWIERLRNELAGQFPEKVTAFHDRMAVHGRFRQPCPDCGAPVQRVVYAANECNYCAKCQTGGRLLADRSLSRLLRDDWPKSIDDI
jgi:formamidopyrimidine-DNA glycosylase